MTRLQWLLISVFARGCSGFVPQSPESILRSRQKQLRLATAAQNDAFTSSQQQQTKPLVEDLPADIAGQFKILTCMSTSCARQRQDLNMDEYSTFSAFYTRAQERAPSLQVEECPCLGQCQAAPCVAVEHEEYEGTVSLEGMTPTEFNDRVFQNIRWEQDADRVWESVENAIRVLTAEEADELPEDGKEGYTAGQGVEV